MNEFIAKLPLYKTAWSPVHDRYVGIRSLHQDENGDHIISAHVQGTPDDQIVLFRTTELTQFCL